MELPVHYALPDPAYEAYTWVYENEHHPASDPPIAWRPGLMTSPTPDGVPMNLSIGGYSYFRWSAAGWGGDPGPDVNVLDLWQQTWLPRVDALVHELREVGPAAVPAGGWRELLVHHETEWMRVFRGVHGRCLFPARAAAEALVDRYAALFGEQRRTDALALLQGFENAALERAAGLWDLSRLLRADAGLARAIEAGLPAGDTSDALGEFRARLAAFLERFGETTQMFLPDLPTWAEDQTALLAIVRGYAGRPDEDGPRDAARRQRERRADLEAELRERARTDGEPAALVALLPAAQRFLPILEDHNFYCDQRLAAASRVRWLRIGAHLHAAGVLATPDDVFFYTSAELVALLEGGAPLHGNEIAARRAQQAAWRATSPPAVLGRPMPTPDGALPADAPAQRLLTGAAASAGSYRGRARVIGTVDAADTLEDGDVLVCATTDPAWTPYFALLGALVTDAGNALSHSAVVAREFGIPAVIGTRMATRVIPDGATVTVDGPSGTVVVEA
jgi:pyruvate,water dikinase